MYSALGVYSTGPDQPTGYIPPADDPWWKGAIDWLGGLFKSQYPKPLPPLLPFTVSQVRDMMAAVPSIKSALIQKMRAQGHTWIYLGHQPTENDWANAQTTAELALWFANGTGDDLSHGEAEIRALVIQGMQAWISQTQGGGSGAGSGGGGTTWPGGGGTTTEATVGSLLGLGVLGAGVYIALNARKRRR